MIDVKDRINKLQQNIARSKAEKELAEKGYKEVKKTLADMNILPENLDKMISKTEEDIKELENQIHNALEEAETVLKTSKRTDD